jgi:hypothetical protein
MSDEQSRPVRLDAMDHLGLDLKRLERVKVRVLTDIQRARLLQVRPDALASTVIELQPSKPSRVRITAVS